MFLLDIRAIYTLKVDGEVVGVWHDGPPDDEETESLMAAYGPSAVYSFSSEIIKDFSA